MTRQHSKTKIVPAGRFRIIGGQWRGRRLQFPASGLLRPTPDRVRETVFNWLNPLIEGARCLDLYAGSGAMGLEALSRGAANCVFVERNRLALDAIRAHAAILGSQNVEFVNGDAVAYLHRCARNFDVIFLDPPFEENPWEQLLGSIVEDNLLRSGGRLYMERAASAGEPDLPEGLELLRSKRAGRVGYHLATTTQETT